MDKPHPAGESGEEVPTCASSPGERAGFVLRELRAALARLCHRSAAGEAKQQGVATPSQTSPCCAGSC